MTRAHIADPHIVAKLMRGEEDRIRPCVGAGYCIDRIYVGGDALCIHNPATGRERTMPHVDPRGDGPRRRVVVVGGGPGGAGGGARVGGARPRGRAARGHRPAGRAGQPRRPARPPPRDPGHHRLAASGEVELAGVEVRLNSYAEADDVLALEPDIVVVATGGLPNTASSARASDLVASGWDVLSGQVGTLRRGPGLRRERPASGAQRGRVPGQPRRAKVTFVVPDRMPAVELGATNSAQFMKALYAAGVRFVPDLALRGVRRDGNRLVATLQEHVHRAARGAARPTMSWSSTARCRPTSSITRSRLARATTARSTWRPCSTGRPQALDRTIRTARYQLFRVGDAVASRNIHAAIYDSLAALQELLIRNAGLSPRSPSKIRYLSGRRRCGERKVTPR